MSDFTLGLSGGAARFDTFHGRQEGGMAYGALRYPSPFFDIGHTYLPTSVSQMFRWCRYYFMVNPLINAVTYKMAEYPITPILIDEEDSKIREQWENIIENILRLRKFQIETGLDYFCYGNAYVSIHFPFEKYLVCGSCKHEEKIKKANYKFRNARYYFACPKCNITGQALVKDVNIKSLRGIRLLRWNPEYIKVETNEITGETNYFFDMPMSLRNDILMGKKHIIETIPHEFVEAVRQSKSLKLTPENVFHLKRPTIAQKDMGLGMPLILPVLKDTYYLQILRKAQEAIAQQQIIPLRILFPQAGSSSTDPYTTTDLGAWRKRIEGEIQKWRLDPNYIPILPLPIGNETVGGEGKALMLHQEMEAWSHQIVAGMHVPIEFVFGGLSYSGSNVSMRMLENQFIGYRIEQLIMVKDFILGRIASYLGMPRPKVKFKRFRMADDLQRAALVFQLSQAQKVSDTTLLDELDFDIVQEEKYKSAELAKQLENQRRLQTSQAMLQNDMLILQAKAQARAQLEMSKAGMPPPEMSANGADAAKMVAGDPSDPMQPQIFGGPPGGTKGGAGGGGKKEQTMPGGGAMIGTETQQPQMGAEALPGMPSNATVYRENSGEAPDGIPTSLQSPLTMNMMGGGHNLLYLARRAATALEKQDVMSRNIELVKMKMQNPQFFGLVQQILLDQQGSQTDHLNPLQSPLPKLKPPRRQNISA